MEEDVKKKLEEEAIACVDKALQTGYERGYNDGKKFNEEDFNYNSGREKGREEAWETARKIISQNAPSGFYNAFGIGIGESVLGIIMDNNVSEVIDKIKECEEKQDNERCCRCIHGCETGRLKCSAYCNDCTAGSNYKEKQDEIKVGDEVVNDITGTKFVIINDEIDHEGRIVGISNDYRFAQALIPREMRKTGRKFPQIAEVLEQMKGSEE